MIKTYFLCFFLFFIILSCSDVKKVSIGKEGQTCFSNNTCKNGLNLQCENDKCVNNCRNYCKNGGSCKVEFDSNNMFCECLEGFSGENCEKEDFCKDKPCKNNSECINAQDDYFCKCKEGFEGVNCEINIDDCDPNPCKNGGTCTDNINSYSCQCITGYSGDKCENCENGYHNENGDCIEDQKCMDDTCGTGQCFDNTGIIVCYCNGTGFTGDRCEIDIDECTMGTDNCDRNAKCTNTTGSFTCACNTGYRGNGIICTDIDECENNTNNCNKNATCTNTEGSFECTCNDGYSGNGYNCEGAFITTWKTDNEGVSANNEIRIKTRKNEYHYDYSIDCNSDGILEAEHIRGNYKCIYNSPGIYKVSIKGEFPAIVFNSPNSCDIYKILSIEQWGSIKWKTMKYAFSYCSNLVINTNDTPDLSKVTDMSYMFSGASSFNGNINSWDVSSVKNMSYMFSDAIAFNQPLNSWDVSKVTDMSYMFSNARSFNQPLNNWDVSSVTDMNDMFAEARSFNQPLNSWNVSKVTNMNGMFGRAASFNQPLNSWDVSNVTNMSGMFVQASSFDQDISSWDISSVTSCWEFDGNTSANWTSEEKPNLTSCDHQ